jgi:uncharacterized membrane protein
MSRTGPLAHIRSRIVRGLLVVLPLLITIWLLRVLFDLVDGNVTPVVIALLRTLGIETIDLWQHRIGIPVLGIVLTAVVVYVIGLVAGNIAGRRVLAVLESWILRVPLVKGIYGSARQLLDAFTVTGKRTFSAVVLIEYPRVGVWTVGFVTAESRHTLPVSSGGATTPMLPVFLPTTPNPTSGWLLLVPEREVLVLEMTIEEGVKLVVSGGIVSPDDLGTRVRPWTVRTEGAGEPT